MNQILELNTKPNTNGTYKVAIQGYSGAFHEVATRLLFEGHAVEIEAHDTFKELIKSVESGENADYGLMAVENTIAGSLMDNYRLLNESSLQIIGEIDLRIQQNLLVWPGQKIEDLTAVHSHPVANVQCREFFAQYPHIELVDDIDTALSAKNIRDKQSKHIGAIASSLAAEIYGLEVLAEGIETNKRNFTRFLLLGRAMNYPVPKDQATKISLCFALDHEVGALHKLLAVLSAYGANLTKIQSAPIIGKEWQYLFYVDLIADKRYDYQQVLSAIQPLTSYMRLLGVYPKGKQF